MEHTLEAPLVPLKDHDLGGGWSRPRRTVLLFMKNMKILVKIAYGLLNAIFISMSANYNTQVTDT